MAYTAAVITVSDKGARGERVDTSGPSLCAILRQDGWDVVYTAIVPDEAEQIVRELLHCTDAGIQLVLTTGGTGFSPRDITPEATRTIIERETPGIPEAMRAESMKITPRGCLSRAYAGIRGRTLIINLPGSEKASRENVMAVLPAINHGVKMLLSEGSAECAAQPTQPAKPKEPSLDGWLREAAQEEGASECGMYLTHRGVVRATAKGTVRRGEELPQVAAVRFSYNAAGVEAAIAHAKEMPGIRTIKVWLNEGELQVGQTLMLVMVGGDIRPHVISALDSLLAEIKGQCVTEEEVFVS